LEASLQAALCRFKRDLLLIDRRSLENASLDRSSLFSEGRFLWESTYDASLESLNKKDQFRT